MSFQPEHRRTFAGRIRRVSENQAAGRSLFVEIELPAERDAAADLRAALKNLFAVEVSIPTYRRLPPEPGFIEGETVERPELPRLSLKGDSFYDRGGGVGP
jgi:hypothetical protein